MIEIMNGEIELTERGAQLTGVTIKVSRDGDVLSEKLYVILKEIAESVNREALPFSLPLVAGTGGMS